MDIRFRSGKLEKQFNSAGKLQAAHGERQATLIGKRLTALRAAQSLGDFWPPYSGPERCHELTGNRKGQLSMDLAHPYRLIFVPAHNPLPVRREGGLDWHQVTAVEILGVYDTHD